MRTRWRIIPLSLCLLACLLPHVARATVEVEITYEGRYVALDPHRFSLYLPDAWVLYASDDALLWTGDPDGTATLRVEAFENTEATTMDALLTAHRTDTAYTQVAPVFYGGVPFVSYDNASADCFGAVTQSADGTVLYHFTFSPAGDEALRTLGRQIMASLQAAE